MDSARAPLPSRGGAAQTAHDVPTVPAGPAADIHPVTGPRLLSSIPEAEPLLCAPSVLPGPKRANGRALHVKFDAASPPAALSSSGSSSSSSSDSEECLAEARPPDGGWGWVVVFASFMVNLIADGITFSFGVFYPHFLEYFGEGKGKTAWIAGIFMAMPLLSGPIASFLTDRYGCRRVTVCGALLAALGFVISAFVDNMETLFLTFGIMAGFGLSLCYVAAVVIVAYYFDKKRSLATGISVCGSGIGTFIFAPLTYVLLDEYGWRGTTLILAGLFLNMAVCGLLFRDLPWTVTMHRTRARERKRKRERKRGRRFGSSADSFSDSRSSAAGSGRLHEQAVGAEEATSPSAAHFSSLVDLPTFMTAGECVSPEVFEMMSSRGRAYALLAQHYPGGGGGGAMLPSRSFSDSGRLHELSPPGGRGALSPDARAAASPPVAAQEKAAPAPARKPGAGAASFLKDVRVHRHSLTYRGAMLNINRYRLRASSCPNIFRNSMTTIAKEKAVWYAGLWDFWDLVVEILDLSHFRNPSFLVFTCSNFLLYMWYDVPYVYIADAAMGLGFDESQSSMLISIIGIVNMFGEILLGWMGDMKRVSPWLVYALCMAACGAATASMPLLRAWGALAAAAGAFGAFIAANYSLTSIILVQQITLDHFTNAYGLLLLVQGMANLIGPPLAGWVYDMTRSYDLSFYLAGVFIALSGLVLLVQPLYACCRPTTTTTTTSTTSTSTRDHGGEDGGGDCLTANGHLKQNGKLIILLGWMGDMKRVSPWLVYALCMAACGAATASMPLLRAWGALAAAAGAFGAFIAANYSLTSIILVQQITLDHFTNAYGLLLLVQGMANLIGPPLAGWVYDMTRSYDLSFYLAGVFIALSGLVLLVQPLYACCRPTTTTTTTSTTSTSTRDHGGEDGGGDCLTANGHLKQNGKLIV